MWLLIQIAMKINFYVIFDTHKTDYDALRNEVCYCKVSATGV